MVHYMVQRWKVCKFVRSSELFHTELFLEGTGPRGPRSQEIGREKGELYLIPNAVLSPPE